MDIEQKLIQEKVPMWIVRVGNLRNAVCNGVVHGSSTGFITRNGNNSQTIYEEERSDSKHGVEELQYKVGDYITCGLIKVDKMERKEGGLSVDGFLSSEYEFPADCTIKVVANYDDAIMLMENLLIPNAEGEAVIEVTRGETVITYRLRVAPDDARPNKMQEADDSTSFKYQKRIYLNGNPKIFRPEERRIHTIEGKVVKTRQDIFGGFHYTLKHGEDEYELWTDKEYQFNGNVKAYYLKEFICKQGGKLVKMEQSNGN